MDLLDVNTSLAIKAGDDTIAQWSDERRADFIKTYQQRTNAARVLLYMTAERVIELAQRRHFISDRHTRKIYEKHGHIPNEYQLAREDTGRSNDELKRIAKDRADAILKELPPMKQAVRVIDPETADMIANVDKLQKRAQKAADKLDELPSELRMSEHKTMLVGDFLKELGKLTNTRKRLAKAIRDCGTEAEELEVTIAKRLYAGLPGITDAVVHVVETHLERAVVLDQLNRRVAERVKFGDSSAAMDLLQGFEADEASVSEEMRAKLAGAMSVLKTKVKALKTKGKKTTKKAATKRGGKAGK